MTEEQDPEPAVREFIEWQRQQRKIGVSVE